VRLEDNVAQLCLALHRKASEYEEATTRRAQADVEYRQARAKRILLARSEGAKSIAEAETVADADDAIAALRLQHLVTEGVCDGLTKSMIALRERIGFGRSRMANEREVDKHLSSAHGGQA
jgi:hypothetical protein